MLAFSRLTSFLLFVLSLSFLTCALPAPAPNSNALAIRGHSDVDLVKLVVDLEADVNAAVKVIADVDIITDLAVHVDALVVKVNTCAQAVAAIGANIDIDASVKADLAVRIAAIITAIVHVCVSVSAKFGILVVVSLFAKIDACLHLLLLNLGVCVQGIIALVANIVVKLGVSVFADVRLNLCLSILGLVGISL
ncbi:Transmembrane protein [Ceratobasidium theobromae]|uniref:Transmembrane protein n=1 Tax=Ceratobasidium theobromae TaxID=1582974 RepID=A0A5N5QB41_9AGAM|nr:Transmembrane protein [Ceratobasidium theobromae]